MIDEQAVKNADVIIHLAGAGVADRRWTQKWKEAIYDSRINSTRLLFNTVREHHANVRHFISASAIGIYGDTGDEWIMEDRRRGSGFLSDVVVDWEREIDRFNQLEIPTTILRMGMVLSSRGGALVEMMKPINLGLGAPLASGKQYMSWIHQDDLSELFLYVLESRAQGVFNAVSPNPVDNRTFTHLLARQAGKPLWLPHVPGFILKLMLGEMADMLIGGNRVSSQKIEATGFKFRYPQLDDALRQLIQPDGRKGNN